MQNRERRYLKEIRASQDGERCIITGYAALFNSDSENLGGFVERIAPGAFDGAEFGECRALFNHDNNYVMASVKGQTLSLEVDERGLKYTFETPGEGFFYDTVYVPIQRGDIDQSSFAFTLDYSDGDVDTWEDMEGTIVRTILKINRVYDVSPVTYPAYQETSVSARALESLESFQSSTNSVESNEGEIELIRQRVELLML